MFAEWVWRRSMRMWSWPESTRCWGTTALRWSVIRGSWSRSENTSTQSETPLYSRSGSRLEFLAGCSSHSLIVRFRLFNVIRLLWQACACSCCLIQVWQEINEETKQVREIMATLESFQLESTPSKPSSFGQENDIMPVHVEHRFYSEPFRQPSQSLTNSFTHAVGCVYNTFEVEFCFSACFIDFNMPFCIASHQTFQNLDQVCIRHLMDCA